MLRTVQRKPRTFFSRLLVAAGLLTLLVLMSGADPVSFAEPGEVSCSKVYPLSPEADAPDLLVPDKAPDVARLIYDAVFSLTAEPLIAAPFSGVRIRAPPAFLLVRGSSLFPV